MTTPPSPPLAYSGGSEPSSDAAQQALTPEDAVQWATKCLDCGDGVRIFDSEDEARDQYERDSAYEDQQPADERHTIVLLRRRMGWTTVTTTAWEGRRDR